MKMTRSYGPRARRKTGISLLDPSDEYGRRSVEGAMALVTARRTRRWNHARNTLFHRAKNGVYDAITFFYLVDELANLTPGQPFTAADLTDHLNRTTEALVWDAVTVGRILNDLIDTWNETNQSPLAQPLVVTRQWSGREYETTNHTDARIALLELLDDLAKLGERVKKAEALGTPPDRQVSPLVACPSVTTKLEGIAV
jgi:hypothetical protein